MQVLHLEELDQDKLQHIFRRAQADIRNVLPRVSEIIESIREAGDTALLRLVNELEFSATSAADLRTPQAEITDAANKVPADLKDAIDLAYSQIWKFHERQRPEDLRLSEIGPGILAGEKTTPIGSVAIYVPRGKGSFPSVVLMLGIPAKVAGVSRVVMITPADRDGAVDTACLYAAHLCGIDEVYRLGGAHAIAALGLGTQTIPPVEKILGPGGLYASAAKRLL